MKYLNSATRYFNWAGQSLLSESLKTAIRENQELVNRLPFCQAQETKLLRDRVENSRSLLVEMFRVQQRESVVFTTGAVHALDIVLKSIISEENIQVCLTSEEFPEVERCIYGFFRNIIVLDFEDIIKDVETKLCDGRKCLFVLSHVSYRTGRELDIKNIILLIRKFSPDSIIIIDASQAVGNVHTTGCYDDSDAIIFNTNKWLQGPYCGVLVLFNQGLIPRVRNGVYCSFSSAIPYSPEMCSSSGLNLAYTASLEEPLRSYSRNFSVLENLNKKTFVRDAFIRELRNNTGAIMLREDFSNSVSGIITFSMPDLPEQMGKEIIELARQQGIFFRVLSTEDAGGQSLLFRFAVHWHNDLNAAHEIVELFKT